MTNTKPVFTLNELLGGEAFGLVVSERGIEQALNHAKRDDYYIGTDVYKWLKNMDIVTESDLDDYFLEFDEDGEILGVDFDVELTEIAHDNSYNWGGNASTEIDFRIFETEFNTFAYVAIHIGGDVRCNYSNGILIDLGCVGHDWACVMLEESSGFFEMRHATVNGQEYSITGGITSEGLNVYNHKTDEEYTSYECVYEPTKEEFDNACIKIVEEAIKG